MDFKVVTAKCSECGNIKLISFNDGESTRYTYCAVCTKPVIWKKINCEDDCSECEFEASCKYVNNL